MEKEEKKKKKAKIQLLIFVIFIIFAFTYTQMLSFRSNNKLNNSNEIIQYNLDDIKNYDFIIDINVTENNINNTYHYTGRINDKNGTITTDNSEYNIINNLYYDNDYELINNVFYKIDNKYLDINNIKNYINEATYNNGQYETTLTEVISNKVENIVIYINETYSSNNINIKIDYSNLMKLYYPNINSYNISYTLSNFN